LGKTINGSDLGQWKKSSSSNQEWTGTNLANSRIITGITPADEPKFQVQLNPNPFTSSFDLKIANPGDVKSIAIYDVLGRRVETIEQSAVSDIMSMGASLKAGMYVVKVYGINWSQSFKVVKE